MRRPRLPRRSHGSSLPLRLGVVGVVAVLAALLALPGQEPGSGAVAAVAVAAALSAAAFPAGHSSTVTLVALVYEAGVAFPAAGPVPRLLLGLGLAVVLWGLHSAYAWAAVDARSLPAQAVRGFARTSAGLLLAAAPAVVVLAGLAVAVSLPGALSPVFRVLGLLAAAGVCALPLLRRRSGRRTGSR